MSSAASSYDLPKTPAAAPPNFYSQAGQMGASAGQPGGASSGGSDSQSDQDPEHQFTKLAVGILDSLNKMKKLGPQLAQGNAGSGGPGGPSGGAGGQSGGSSPSSSSSAADRYLKAAALAIKDALKAGLAKGQDAAGSSSSTGDGGDIPSAPDQPANASASAAGSAAGPGAGGSAPTAV